MTADRRNFSSILWTCVMMWWCSCGGSPNCTSNDQHRRENSWQTFFPNAPLLEYNPVLMGFSQSNLGCSNSLIPYLLYSLHMPYTTYVYVRTVRVYALIYRSDIMRKWYSCCAELDMSVMWKCKQTSCKTGSAGIAQIESPMMMQK